MHNLENVKKKKINKKIKIQQQQQQQTVHQIQFKYT